MRGRLRRLVSVRSIPIVVGLLLPLPLVGVRGLGGLEVLLLILAVGFSTGLLVGRWWAPAPFFVLAPVQWAVTGGRPGSVVWALMVLFFISMFAITGVLTRIAIKEGMQYRNIQSLINRALVYGALTTILALTYTAAVLLLQPVLRPLAGGGELGVAVSTLGVVALFAPLRRRIQDLVDRQFYRSRYDAARTLDAFGLRLRDQVDLDSVRADLLDVVRDTVRPAHASVWLRESARGEP